MHGRALGFALLALIACDAPSTATPDASPEVANVDVASVDVASVDAVDASVACASADASDLLRALRAPRAAGVSAVAAPGLRFEDLRAQFDASPAALALLEQARGAARAPVATLANGDASTYQTVASRALAAALVAWHDHNATAAQTALRSLAATAVTPAWLAAAEEVPIRVGASLVTLAAAVDLLSAASLSPTDMSAARASLGRTMTSVEAWLQAGGQIVLLYHTDNHGMRMGAGLVAASMVAPPESVDDELLGYGLAQMALSMRRQTGGASGWAEGSTYYAYAFEVAAAALLAVDRAWVGDDRRCVRCPTHRLAACATRAVELVRPSRDPIVRDLALWGASIETRGGWLLPIDDSRFASLPAPLLERVVGFTAFARWAPDGPTGSVGGSVNVGPLVALALASPEILEHRFVSTPLDLWAAAGTARLDGTAKSAAPIEVYLLGEQGAARDGAGHEHPDVLGLTVVVGGALMLGASGYNTYDDRFPYARADASSGITLEGVLPRAMGTGEAGPAATLEGGSHALSARFVAEGVTVSRALTLEAGVLQVVDHIEVTGEAREVAWHWHLRGELDPTAFRWTHGTHGCVASQTNPPRTTVHETAPGADTYGRVEMHPVVRQSERLPAGRYDFSLRITCS